MSGPRGLAARRRRDRTIAALIAAVLAVAGVVVYLKSDARATTLNLGETLPVPAAMTEAPAALRPVWELSTLARFPAVASPYGTVVTAGEHTITGYDSVTGAQRWSYSRSNLLLCAFGSGDTQPQSLSLSGAVRGVFTGYSKGDACSELTTFNPATGERNKQRTGFTGVASDLAFGGPYGGLISTDLVELWRYDLVRTIQYGNQPEPTKPNSRHLGCDFVDLAMATTQFGTIEHCAAAGTSAQLVLNYADPGATADGKSKGWDALRSDPRATIDLGSDHARLLSMSPEEALVLVASPSPAAVVYNSTGAEVSRVPVGVPAADIEAADDIAGGQPRVTPVVLSATARYVLVGSSLVAVRTDGLQVLWTMPGVLGKPAVIGNQLLVPVADGLAVVDSETGRTATTVPVDRAGYQGTVTVGTIGNTVVETRGTTVIGLRDPNGPAVDAPATTQSSGRDRPPVFGTSSTAAPTGPQVG